MQLGVVGLVLFIWCAFLFIQNKDKFLYLLIIPMIALCLDAYRLYPYSPLSPIESEIHKHEKSEFSVMIFNVLQTNEEKKKLADLVVDKNPDFVFLFEVDKKWTDSLDSIPGYPERYYHPLDNTYGIAFISRKKLDSASIKFLVKDDVPSYEIKFRPDNGDIITIFAVHPRPPAPPDDSHHRDAELVIVAKKAREIKGPVIVLGDMNDVAWSHTTRLFRRISGLLDPRVGRRPYSTFPAVSTIFRYPLDYIFHSKELKLTNLEVLPDISSDHLPLIASFYLDYKNDQESTEKPDSGDFQEAKKILKKGKEE